MTSLLEDPRVLAFEAAAVDQAHFDHRAHLYVAWCYLRELPLEEAIGRYVRHLKRLTRALGVPHKFHATMTWGYLILLHEALRDPALEGADFDAVARARPALFDSRGALSELYGAEELADPRAREHFVLPRARRAR